MFAGGKLFPINLLIFASFAKLFLPAYVIGFVWADGGGGGTNFCELCVGGVILCGTWFDFGWSFFVSFWILLFLGGLLYDAPCVFLLDWEGLLNFLAIFLIIKPFYYKN